MTERFSFYPLGTKGTSGENEHLLGHRAYFDDVNHSATGIKPVLSGMVVEAIWVKNKKAGTLAAGAPVYWANDSTYGPGKAVGDVSGDDARTAGFVDPWISGTVAANEHFWLIVKGPTKVRYDGSATINIRSEICSGGSGNVRAFTSGTDDFDSYAGVALEAKTSGSAGDLFRALVDCTY